MRVRISIPSHHHSFTWFGVGAFPSSAPRKTTNPWVIELRLGRSMLSEIAEGDDGAAPLV